MAPRTFPHFFSFSLSRALLENELESHASLLLLLLPLFIVAVREEGGWPEIPIPAIFPMEGKAGCPDLEQISFGFPPPLSSCPHQDCVARGVETKRALCGSFFSFLSLMALLLITFYARASPFPPSPSLPLPLTSPFCPHFLTEKRGGGEGDGRWKGGRQSTHKGGGKRKENGREKSHYLYFLRGRDLFNLTRGGSTCIMNVHASSFEASNDPNRSE